MRHSNNKGFTLIEATVAVAISSILAMVLLTILRMNNDGVSRGAVNTFIQRQYETVVQQIGFNTRKAHAVLDGNNAAETWAAFLAGGLASKRTSCIKMCDTAGNQIGGYKITGTNPRILQEYDPGTSSYKAFKVGGKDTVHVIDSFGLSSDRTVDTVRLRVFSSLMKDRDTTDSRLDLFRCRN